MRDTVNNKQIQNNLRYRGVKVSLNTIRQYINDYPDMNQTEIIDKIMQDEAGGKGGIITVTENTQITATQQTKMTDMITVTADMMSLTLTDDDVSNVTIHMLQNFDLDTANTVEMMRYMSSYIRNYVNESVANANLVIAQEMASLASEIQEANQSVANNMIDGFNCLSQQLLSAPRLNVSDVKVGLDKLLAERRNDYNRRLNNI